jgi:hypothetical protein
VGFHSTASGDHRAINYSYSLSTVSGESELGGLVGANQAPISSCYSAGKVTGATRVGGLVGQQWSGSSISGSYYDTDASGSDAGAGTGKSTAAMKQEATFSGWDFFDVWGLDSEINNGYPYLLYTKR